MKEEKHVVPTPLSGIRKKKIVDRKLYSKRMEHNRESLVRAVVVARSIFSVTRVRRST
jgi:hypothetical protein